MDNIDVWASETLKKIHTKMVTTSKRNEAKIPYIVQSDGYYNNMAEKNVSWWTNGFYAGSLWQLYGDNQDSHYLQEAKGIEELLDEAFDYFLGIDHDAGFLWLPTAVVSYRETQSERSKERALHAAGLLSGRFNLKGRFIRAWNGDDQLGYTIIDSMMNIPLLFWATMETGDPRFSQIAEAHAETVMKYLVREDGSVAHIGKFDSLTGDFLKLSTGQAYSSDSAWTRGQAWGIYGFALSYGYTKDPRFLNTAKKIANYFIACVSQTGYIPTVDFRAEHVDGKIDASAGTIAACGLLELATCLSVEEGAIYRSVAHKILVAISEKCANYDENRDGIIDFSSHSYHKENESMVSIIYGDYYFIEGVLRLLGKETAIFNPGL